MRPLVALALVACTDGPAPESTITDLQVVAAVATPPAGPIGAPYGLEVVVADPAGAGADLWVWGCDDEACDAARPTVDDGIASVDRTTRAAGPEWVLACAPGVCGEPTERELRDPGAWLRSLPTEGVSLAVREVRVEGTRGAELPVNPEIVEAPEGLRAVTAEEVALHFVVPGAAAAYGYAVGGGFERASVQVASDGAVRLAWLTPDEPGTSELFAVFQDDDGGVAVWSERVEVR